MSTITPDDVSRLTRPTDGFLCPLSANSYGVEFLSFAIMDYETKNIIFEVGKDKPPPSDMSIDFSSSSASGEDMYRRIKYNFSEDVLRLPYIQTTLVFGVGEREINDFRMIERHYFRNQLVKSFDFSFGFCIPGSVNTWESVYSLPPLSESLLEDMINNPFETVSDSFYFINNRLIMHNKASYKYFREDAAQEKKSYEAKYGSKSAKVGAKGSKAASKTAAGAAGEEGEAYLDEPADAKTTSGDTVAAKPAGAKAAKGTGGGGSGGYNWSKESDYI